MIRIVTLILAMSASAVVLAQVPPGDSYDASKHINPIVTFVLAKDFKTSSYDTAGTEAGISLLGLSKDVGTLENVETAAAGIQEVREGRNSMKVTFYPVVRQTFKLADGGALVLCSFKAPRPQSAATVGRGGSSSGPFGIPIGRGRDPKDTRFGTVPAPEQLEIRGMRGLLFEKDGTLIVAWQEDGVIHTATSSMARRALFRILDDLL